MQYQLAGCLVLLGLSCVAQAADPLDRHQLNSLTQEDLRAREIIRRADRVRAPERPFRYTLTLLEHKEGRDVTENRQVLDISMRFYKPSEQVEKGDARALVRFISPVRDKGKALLSDLDKMWYYAPDLRRPIPISRQQRLVGQISNGDVVAADFDYSYISRLVGEEACGQTICYKLSLQRRWPYVTYPAISYWVEKTPVSLAGPTSFLPTAYRSSVRITAIINRCWARCGQPLSWWKTRCARITTPPCVTATSGWKRCRKATSRKSIC